MLASLPQFPVTCPRRAIHYRIDFNEGTRTMKYRVHVLVSIEVEASSADRAKHFAYREMEKVS
jgi:hypothetical protein